MSNTNNPKKSACINGGCLCGAVRFSAELPEKWCAHCHCTMCRRAHGAGYVTWVGFHSERVQFENSSSALKWHRSSADSRRGFCTHCGSSLFFESGKWSGETHIALGCVDEPHTFKPDTHACHDTHVNWMPLEDGLTITPD